MASLNLGPKSTTKLLTLASIFVTSLLMANILASKLIVVAGFVITAGIIAFPVTFLITDVINEVWGKRLAQKIVWLGLLANLIMLVFFKIGLVLPPAVFWGDQESFEIVLGAVHRIVIESKVAYTVSQSWDVWFFNKIKENLRFGLWFRNNASTMVSQALDSAIFIPMAFWGVMPASALLQMYLVYIVVKWLIALGDTPFCYLGVKWLRSTEHE